ncbi:hypothetical protein PIB30_082622 [Stylosanthes scabra]|uniref:Uncharacterized protein n=1 Tax=Stylosanthes scabra TaxID=79078 RepID=A0ABU6STE4_9FABA|nr:hypothetical protein [Stylosanthes scabra]
MDLRAAAENQIQQLHELQEFRNKAYNNSIIYKERTKQWHDKRIQPRVLEPDCSTWLEKAGSPKPKISEELIHEFYANAIITEEEMEENGGHSYESFVRGVPLNFSPDNIRRVMRFKAQVERARIDFET